MLSFGASDGPRATSMYPSIGPKEPTDQQLLERLERDVEWLEARGAWTAALLERAARRYVNARRSAEGLDDFMRRHQPAPTVVLESPERSAREES